ncbi:MAG: hypothetical protein HKN76_00615 [Saprospiraceae bacterium]|nr:hypothetical protein [Saprospiraceae bacterium]
MKKIIGYLLLVGIIVGGIGYYYTQRDYRDDIKYTDADVEINATDLFAAFEVNEDDANTRFLGKIILVEGVVLSVDHEGEKITIKLDSGDPMGAIVCEMNRNIESDVDSVKAGDSLSIKGECSGKLFDIILVNCVMI